MRKKSLCDLPGKNRRTAFTLIELLVVIAILATLAALTAGAVIKFLGSQQEANTKSTLNKTKSQLDKAWSKVKDQAYQEPIPAAYLPAIQALAGTGIDPNATGRVRVIYVKLKLRQAFPMSFNEALNPSPLPPLPAYTTYLNGLGITSSSAASANLESSACLLMALQRGVSGAGIDPSQLTGGGATGAYQAPAGTLPYLTDAWGAPIYFTRVPTGCPVLNPLGPQGGANDPGDPQGYLNSGSWPQPLRTAYSNLTLQQLAPGNSSYKLAPMVGSSGSDKVLQFDPITFTPTANADDLFCNP